MVRTSSIGLPVLLVLAGAGVALSLVHFVVYLVRLGAGSDLALSLGSGAHAYWPTFAALTLLTAAPIVFLTRRRVERAPRQPSGAIPTGRRAIAVWTALLSLTIVGFLVMENAETLFGSGRLAGVAPLAWLFQPLAIVGVISSLTLVAGAIVIVVRERTASYSTTLVESYQELVGAGTYSATFAQSGWAEDFVATVLAAPLGGVSTRPISVLECGSGSGLWLAQLAMMPAAEHLDLYGFDLSPDMVRASRERLAVSRGGAEIKVGDLFDPQAYAFGGRDRHDVVFAFDVIQQLPSRLQRAAVTELYEHVAPGGWLVIFDHDRRSKYGRVMGAKKWLRRYFDVPLVPRYYIHARYPDLGALRRVVERAGGTDVSIVVESEKRKRALLARRAA